MKKPLTINLHPGETVIAVVPQYASGPGWGNHPTWVYIRRNDGTLREECIQPEEQTVELHTLYRAGEEMCKALRLAVPTKRVKAKP